MTDKIVTFPKSVSKKKTPVGPKNIEQIGILTKDDRDLWINNQEDIAKIIRFIVQEKIKIYEDKEK